MAKTTVSSNNRLVKQALGEHVPTPELGKTDLRAALFYIVEQSTGIEIGVEAVEFGPVRINAVSEEGVVDKLNVSLFARNGLNQQARISVGQKGVEAPLATVDLSDNPTEISHGDAEAAAELLRSIAVASEVYVAL